MRQSGKFRDEMENLNKIIEIGKASKAGTTGRDYSRHKYSVQAVPIFY